MNDQTLSRQFQAAAPIDADEVIAAGFDAIGLLSEVGGSRGEVRFEIAMLAALAQHSDPVVAAAGQLGSQIKVRAGGHWLLANVRSLKVCDTHQGEIVATVDFLGEGSEERLTGKLFTFRRGVTRYPLPGSLVYPVSTADLRQVYAADGRVIVDIGTVYPTRDVRAPLHVDSLLGRHFALIGSTGTGKSTAAALILHRICDVAPEGHVVLIDPHGEYPNAFSQISATFDVTNIAMPYWLMNFEEHCETFVTASGAQRQIDCDILAKCLLAARAKGRPGQDITKLTVDAPVPYMLSDLIGALNAEMGRLDRAGDTTPYLRLKTKIDELRVDPRYGFMFSGMLVADNMAGFLAKIFRLPSGGKPISVIDVSGVPSEITSVVVAMLGRMIFDFAIWSRGERLQPLLLVCEEAHRYIPNEEQAATSSAARVIARIAKEGRKYGVALGLITQRPSDLAEGVLSQCGTIIAMRLNNERDQAFVRAAMPEGSRGFLDVIPALRNRECIICGEGVTVPIRVSFDQLEEGKRPASADPVFSQLWSETGDEENIIARSIRRWRGQAH